VRHPLYKGLDLEGIHALNTLWPDWEYDAREYLAMHSMCHRLLETDPEMRAQWQNAWICVDAAKTAFRIQLMAQTAKAVVPCTSRWPVVEDQVKLASGEEYTSGDWVLKAGAVGIVSQVDSDGHFKLQNAEGQESPQFNDRMFFVYAEVSASDVLLSTDPQMSELLREVPLIKFTWADRIPFLSLPATVLQDRDKLIGRLLNPS
jgi:hypothetical protein